MEGVRCPRPPPMAPQPGQHGRGWPCGAGAGTVVSEVTPCPKHVPPMRCLSQTRKRCEVSGFGVDPLSGSFLTANILNELL